MIVVMPNGKSDRAIQRALCTRFGAEFLEAPDALKLGLAEATLGQLPLNGLRHLPVGNTCGWYLWGGTELSQEPDFFQPVHVAHVAELCPRALLYLGLAPGWRFLIAPDYEDVWFDPSIVIA